MTVVTLKYMDVLDSKKCHLGINGNPGHWIRKLVLHYEYMKCQWDLVYTSMQMRPIDTGGYQTIKCVFLSKHIMDIKD